MNIVSELRRGRWVQLVPAPHAGATGHAVDPSPLPAQAADEIERLIRALAEQTAEAVRLAIELERVRGRR